MQKYSRETQVGVFVLIGLACVAYLTLKLGKLDLFGADAYTLTAKFTSVTGLRPGADVEISGVPIGKVTSITLDEKQYLAVVAMSLPKSIQLSDDVIASVKTSGLIGDKYIRLSPGGSEDMLGDGGAITETESAVDLEALISKYIFGDVNK